MHTSHFQVPKVFPNTFFIDKSVIFNYVKDHHFFLGEATCDTLILLTDDVTVRDVASQSSSTRRYSIC